MDVTRTLAQSAPRLLLILLCSLPPASRAADAATLQAQQDAALARLKAVADTSIASAGTAPVDWELIEARLSDFYASTAQVADIPSHETKQGFLLCINTYDAMSEVYRVNEADQATRTSAESAAAASADDVLAANPDLRRLHTQAFLEQMRCTTRMLNKDAESWPVEGTEGDNINRMLGMQTQPFRAFTMAVMGGMMSARTPPEERAALAAQAIPVVRELAPALAPEMRENVMKVTQDALDQAKLDDPSPMQAVIDAFKTDACTLSCQRSKGKLGDS